MIEKVGDRDDMTFAVSGPGRLNTGASGPRDHGLHAHAPDATSCYIDLPTDKPRRLEQPFHRADHQFTLEADVREKLNRLTLGNSAESHLTLLAAFGTLLFRYSGQETMTIGSIDDSDSDPRAHRLARPAAAILAMTLDLAGEPTFLELVQRVRDCARTPGQATSGPGRSGPGDFAADGDSYRNLRVLFQWAYVDCDASDKADSLSLRSNPMNDGAQCDLALALIGTPRGIQARLEYNAELFEPATIARMVGHWQTLLRSIAADPNQSIGELPLLTEPERRQVIDEWNDTRIQYPTDHCIHDLVEAAAARYPDAVSLVDDRERLTYAELSSRAGAVSHVLRRLGVKPGVLVAVYMERSTDMIVALLAVLKAGGAYVPIDPAYPVERVTFMLNDSKALAVLTQRNLQATLPIGPWHTIAVDDRAEEALPDAPLPSPRTVCPEDLAYVIYTSGSTGRPKGVPISHRNVLNLVYWHQRAFSVTSSDRATQLAGPAFDATVWEIWPYLTAGAAVCIPNERTKTSPESLRDWIAARGITLCFMPTPLAEAAISLEWPKGTSLRALLTGADTLHHYPPATLPFALVNNYGPTECTVVATSGLVRPARNPGSLPSIGRPIANVRTYVLDSKMQPVPIGVPGEMYIGGDGVTNGYLHRPGLTATCFVADPFDPTPGARLYRTGDRVRRLADGSIAFMGRLDDQVKIRGYRIEPSEIVNWLNRHPRVQASHVRVRENSAGDRWLEAYVVPASSAAPIPDDLRAHLRSYLPDYMVPTSFVTIDALPLTPNGKVDADALPTPDMTDVAGAEGFAAPRTPIEKQVAGILSGLLGLPRVGVDNNFFMLGGHSLLGTQLIARLRDAFGVEMSLRGLFEAPTIAALSADIERLIVARLDAMSEEEAERLLA